MSTTPTPTPTPTPTLLNYDKLNDRAKNIIKKQVKSLYNKLEFRKFAELSHLNPSSGSYKSKLKLLFQKEMDNDRLVYIYVYNQLRPDCLIKPEPNNNDIMFSTYLPLSKIADRLKDSLNNTKKRLATTTKNMNNALELLEDQIIFKKTEEAKKNGLTDDDKELVKTTILDMIEYVKNTKNALLEEALKEEDEPFIDFSALNPFNKPLEIKLSQGNAPIPFITTTTTTTIPSNETTGITDANLHKGGTKKHRYKRYKYGTQKRVRRSW